MAMIRSNGVRNRLVTSLGDRRNRMDDVCDWILVEFNPGLDSMNFLKGDAPLGIWGFAVVKSEFCAAA